MRACGITRRSGCRINWNWTADTIAGTILRTEMFGPQSKPLGYVCIGAAWKQIIGMSVAIDGAWREVSSVSITNGAEWRPAVE